MSRLLITALLLTSCAAEVPPRADAGDPRVLPVGATAALDGSFSEGDGLTYAWAVAPAGGLLTDPTSPFATFTAEAPGFYTLTLEVCDEAGRCDVAETWARVDDAPGNTQRISSWSPDLFGGSESGAGLPGAGLGAWSPSKTWCEQCYKAAKGGTTTWQELCRTIPKSAKDDANKCWAVDNLPNERARFCDARCAK